MQTFHALPDGRTTAPIKTASAIEREALNSRQHIKVKDIGIRGPFSAFAKIETALATCEAELGAPVSLAEDITSLPNADKVVLLVLFSGGLKIKLCIFASTNSVFENSNRLISAVRSGNFPRVLCGGDGWAAFEWIEGKPLSREDLSGDIVHEAARLLTIIHNAKVEPAAVTPETTLNEVRLKLKEKLPVLVGNEILTAAQSQRITDLCNSLAGDSLHLSLIHGDFSPANLVMRENKLYSVDNEKMRLHVTDYDVCRAATFWDEWNLSGGLLFDAYAKESGRTFAEESLFFWGLFDLVYRISYRVSAFGEFNEFCIMRLRQTLRTGAFR